MTQRHIPGRVCLVPFFTMGYLREITVHDRTPEPTSLRKESRSKFVFFAGTSVHMGVGMGGTSLSQLTDVPAEK